MEFKNFFSNLNYMKKNKFKYSGMELDFFEKAINWKKYYLKLSYKFFKKKSDFLEVGAELGILGLVFYLSIFFFALISLYKHFIKNKQDPYIIALISIFIVYLVDANINFPFIRASQQFYLALFLALTLYIKNISHEDNN